ncbi:RICIN domain-containing protein [Streptomyces sp. NPDC002870]|uniref:RICIN domain-containing protein n=1 Tax=Streptomyces sp. NPDC002870 TaxID=3364666 RepID=UPI0036A89E32
MSLGQDRGRSEPRTASEGGPGREPARDPAAIRQAVTLAAVAGDPGDSWASGGRRGAAAAPGPAAAAPAPQSIREEAPTAPAAEPASPAAEAPSLAAAGPRAEPDRTGEPGRTGETAAARPAAARAEAAQNADNAPAAPTAVASARGADGDGPSPDGAGEPSAPGRPKKPMLAAAALVGAVLLAVPLVLSGQGDEDRADIASADVTQDLLLADGEDAPQKPGTFVAQDDVPEAPKGPQKPEKEGGTEPDAGPGPAPQQIDVADEESGPDDGNGGGGAADESPKPQAQRPTGRSMTVKTVTVGWDSQKHRLANEQTDKCLVMKASSRRVVQGSCSGDTWQRYTVGDGTFLLKSVAANRCLDTDGKELYLSSCTTKDPGQRWKLPTAGGCDVSIVSKQFGKHVTGWNDGSVTLGAADSGAPDKRKWKAPTLVSGC